jgi:hypothetical protein
MLAFETNGTIDNDGFLLLEQPIALRNRSVKVLILLEEQNETTEWVKAVAQNPSFDFLNDDEEDIYTKEDGVKIEL